VDSKGTTNADHNAHADIRDKKQENMDAEAHMHPSIHQRDAS
jgi:hypothetical protein